MHRVLGKYPGAIATTLTKVNEIYGGRTWTLPDFSMLWHLHLVRQLRWNENIISQIPSSPMPSMLTFLSFFTLLSSCSSSFRCYMMWTFLKLHAPPTPKKRALLTYNLQFRWGFSCLCPKGLPVSACDYVCMHFINNWAVSTSTGQLMRCGAMDFPEPCVAPVSRAEAHVDFIQGRVSVELP